MTDEKVAKTAEEPKEKQARLPLKGGATTDKNGAKRGHDVEEIAEVEKKAKILREVRTDRMDLTQREVKAQDDLLKVMTEHKVKEYRLDNTLFVVNRGKDKVKMKRVSDEDDDAPKPSKKKD